MALAALAATSGGRSARSPSATRSSCLGLLPIDLILPWVGALAHPWGGGCQIDAGVIDHARDREESVGGDKGSILELTARGGLFRHPGRDRQASPGELNAEGASRLLVDEDRKKPLADQRVERVQDGDDPATGIVGVASVG